VLSVQRCRELLGSTDLSDEAIADLREQLYALAEMVAGISAANAGRYNRVIEKMRPADRADVGERAAILEFDGQLSRDEAERLAVYLAGRRTS